MRFKFKIILLSLLIFIWPLLSWALSADLTHPGLSSEAVNLFNLYNPESPISNKERELIEKGSTDEDNDLRWLHHFYNPSTQKGLWGLASSKEWGFSSDLQKKFSIASSSKLALILGLANESKDFSYPRAVRDYQTGDLPRSFYSLGHVLHLLQDLSVPEHSRDDAHPKLHNSVSSPYEVTMEKWHKGNISLAGEIFKTKLEIPKYEKPEMYLDQVAQYSHNYFFSADTIQSSKYPYPKISSTRIVNGALIAMGKEEDGQEFPLAVLNVRVYRNIVQVSGASLIDSRIGTMIMDEYWSRLSKKSLIMSAGLISNFIKDVQRRNSARTPGKLIGKIAQAAPVDNKKGIGDITDKIGDKKATEHVTNPVTNVGIQKEAIKATPSAGVSNMGRVFISEVAWGGTIHSPSDEWIELYNDELFDVNLGGWALKSMDNSPTITMPQGLIIKAKSYLLIERTDDQTVANLGADLVTSFGHGLNDSGEGLILVRDDGVTSDSIILTDKGWPAGGKEKSMERSDLNSQSWHSYSLPSSPFIDASGNQILGSPKSENSPKPQSLPIPDRPTLPTPTPEDQPSSGGSSSGSFPENDEQDNEPESEQNNTISTGADIGQIYINEVAWMGTQANSSDEWIELYNPSSASLNITGWRLTSNDGSPDIVLSGNIEPNGFYLIERTDDQTVSNITADLFTSFGSGGLKNTGEVLTLFNHLGQMIDQAGLADGWPAGSSESHSSMERISPISSGSLSNSWITYGGTGGQGLDSEGGVIYGTPRRENCSCEPEEQSNLPQSDIEDEQASASFALTYPWSMFGANSYHTQSIPDGFIPTASISVKWERSVGNDLGQPILSPDGTIWMGQGPVGNSFVAALSMSGDMKFKVSTSAKPSVGSFADKRGYFGHFDPGYEVISISENGSKSWGYEINDRVDKITSDNNQNLYFTSENNKLTALDKDGKLIWQVHNTSIFSSAPIAVNKQVIVSGRLSGVPHVYSYDLENGELKWEAHFDEAGISGISDLTYDSVSNKILAGAGPYLISIDPDGSNLRATMIVESGMGTPRSAPAIGKNIVYLVFEDVSGDGTPEIVISALNRADLTKRWEKRQKGIINNQISVNGQDHLFVGLKTGLLMVMDNEGELVSSFNLDKYTELSPLLVPTGIIWGYGDTVVFLGV